MARSRLLTLCIVLLLTACTESALGPAGGRNRGDGDIVDALHGTGGNPHFFWLAPMVAQPSDDIGEFESLASPTVVICSLGTAQTCEVAIESAVTPGRFAEFTRGAGLAVEADHFQVNFDTRAFGLGAGTTYRILVYSDPLTEFGGPFLLGYADFQVAESGQAAKRLDAETDALITLVDGRTLPIKFAITREAYSYELRKAAEEGRLPPEPGEEPLCEQNCSFTFIAPDDTTLATLASEPGGTEVVTAMQFLPGDVSAPSVLIIDERETEEPNPNCAPGVNLDKRYCYNYVITPDVPFNDPVRFGICPRELFTDPRPWRIMKVDYDEQDLPILTRPPEVDVSDFLPCTSPGSASLLQRALHFAANWLVAPLAARGSTPMWGATAKDLSHLFWAVDATLEAVSADTGSVPTGSVVSITVRITADSSGTWVPVSWDTVKFVITEGTGSIATSDFPWSNTTLDVLTDTLGEATVNWTVGVGANTLEVDSHVALGGPLSFQRTAGATGSWAAVGSLVTARSDPEPIPLAGGQVLVTGGTDGGIEIFDPVTGISVQVSTVNQGQGGTATLLADGRVLLIGELFGGAGLYYPATLEVTATNSPPVLRRLYHTATLLADGRVLVAGGRSVGGDTTFATAELFDPATGSFTLLADSGDARTSHDAVRLLDGRVLLAGGMLITGPGSATGWETADLYDPRDNSITPTGRMAAAHSSATLLTNGRVLVAGWTSSAEIFDPATSVFTVTSAPLFHRNLHAATLLADGRVLISGGYLSGPTGNVATTKCELYDPATGTFVPAPDMLTARQQHAAVVLPDGRVLVFGGRQNQSPFPIGSVEVFDPNGVAP